MRDHPMTATTMGAVLYIAVECDTASAAQSMLRNFIAAGHQDTNPRVHVSIVEPDSLAREQAR